MKWSLVTVPIKQLKEHPRNPRQLSKKQADDLQKSLDRFGLIDKPVITQDHQLIGGHQRIKLLKKNKVKEVECWIPDEQLSEKDIDELCIRLNKNTGDWDFDVLADQWDATDLIDWGFTIDDLVGPEAEEVTQELEDDESETLEPGKDEDAYTKPGDLYELGPHRLVCGDSTLPDTVEKCLGGALPILMVTDPPYGVEYDPSWRDAAGKGCRAKGKVQNDDKINWALAWHLFPGSSAYVWHAGKYCSEVQKSLEEAEYEMISQIIWIKQHFALSRGDYHWQHEPCWYAVKKGHQHNWQGSRKESTVWEIANLNCIGKSKEDGEERTAHSTQKPIECMARPIRNNSAAGEGVYDPFLGSGTTLIAAEKLGRICYGIELSPAYCDIIVKRWADLKKKNNEPHEIKRNGEIVKDFLDTNSKHS
jgi:DNA modification methylase